MKKISFFSLLLILAVQINCNIVPVLAQEGDDDLAIQGAIKIFYESDGRGDLSSAVSQVSPNFSAVVNGEKLDYDKNITFMKKREARLNTRFLDYSNYNIKTTKLKINGNNVGVEVDYDWQGVDRKTNKDMFGHKRRFLTLAKENGTWKITSIEDLTVTEQ